MANRYPLVLDTADGNKIKEIPDGDSLFLRGNNIEGVQNINAIGTINAADIQINGERLQPQSLLDLVDTPNTFAGGVNKFLKVNSTGSAIEYAGVEDLGTISVDDLEVLGNVLPGSLFLDSDIGAEDNRFTNVYSNNLVGNLLGFDGTLVFNANTSKISYAAIFGAPNSLSDFVNDVGYVTQDDVDAALAAGITISDFKGSVFGDDSTLLVDAVNSTIDASVITGSFVQQINAPSVRTNTLINNNSLQITTDGVFLSQEINIETGGTNSTINIRSESINILGTITSDLNLQAKINAQGGVTGDITGSVYFDNSTIIIDGVNGKIVSPSVTGNATFENDVTVQGNLVIQGTTTSVETTNTTVTDNVITLNQGEAGAGVTAGTSGIEIDRGSEANVNFVWDDNVDKWSVGTETIIAATFEGDLAGDVTGDVQGNLTGDSNGTHTGPVLGTVTGELVGSVFADDSGVLVDGVNGTIPGTLTGSWNNPGNAFAVIGDGFSVSTPSSAFAVSNTALAYTLTFTDGALAYSVSDSGISMAFSDADDALAFSIGNNGIAISQARNSKSSSLSLDEGELSFAATNDINLGTATDIGLASDNFTVTSSGTVTYNVGTNFLVTAPNVTINADGVSANITGNIDNATNLDIGTSTATNIDIGNVSSTTRFIGDVSFANALFANNITADDSISITTASGDGNAINIGPAGTNTTVRLQADSIEFNGNIVTDIQATAGVTGDLKGSVFGDDSTVLVDAVNNYLVADKVITPRLENTSTLTLASDTDIVMNAATSAYLQSSNGNFNIVAQNGAVGLSDFSGAGNISISDIDGSINLGTTGTITIQGAATSPINIGVGTSGTVTLGHGGNSIVLNGTIDFSSAIVLGLTVTGDLKGSVFADDSSLLVDAVNGIIPGYISIDNLKTITAASADFAAFKAAIAAL